MTLYGKVILSSETLGVAAFPATLLPTRKRAPGIRNVHLFFSAWALLFPWEVMGAVPGRFVR